MLAWIMSCTLEKASTSCAQTRAVSNRAQKPPYDACGNEERDSCQGSPRAQSQLAARLDSELDEFGKSAGKDGRACAGAPAKLPSASPRALLPDTQTQNGLNPVLRPTSCSAKGRRNTSMFRGGGPRLEDGYRAPGTFTSSQPTGIPG